VIALPPTVGGAERALWVGGRDHWARGVGDGLHTEWWDPVGLVKGGMINEHAKMFEEK